MIKRTKASNSWEPLIFEKKGMKNQNFPNEKYSIAFFGKTGKIDKYSQEFYRFFYASIIDKFLQELYNGAWMKEG